MKDTLPGVPTFPPPLVNALRTFAAVRFLLSVRGIYDDSDAIRTISLICKILVIDRVCISGCFLDTTIDGIVRHIVRFAFAITSRRRLLFAGSEPPSLTATAISRPITVKIFPFAASFLSFVLNIGELLNVLT